MDVLLAMGFPEDQAEAALEAAGGDVRRAVEMITETSPVASTPWLGSSFYICRSNAVVTAALEAKQHTVLKKILPGQRVHVLNVAETATGQKRAQTKDGWISVVSANGTVLLEVETKPLDIPEAAPSPEPASGGGGSASAGGADDVEPGIHVNVAQPGELGARALPAMPPPPAGCPHSTPAVWSRQACTSGSSPVGCRRS